MTLDRNDKLTALYLWAESLRRKFHDESGWYEDDEVHTNLCYFIRRIFVYTPLILLVELATYFAPIYAIVIYPAKRLGPHWWLFPMWFGIAGAIIVLIYYVALWIQEHNIRRAEARYREEYTQEGWLKLKEKQAEEKRKREERKPSTLEIVLQYLITAKRNICPIICIPAKKED